MAKKIDWLALKQQYVSHPTETYKTLGREHNVSSRSIAWHSQREHWRRERSDYCNKLNVLLVQKSAKSASETIQQLNAEQLRRSEQMRTLLVHKMFVKTPEGVVPRNVTISAIARAVGAFSALYHLDRSCLGADVGGSLKPHCSECDRLSRMSDDELLEELQQLRARSVN